MRMSYVVVVSVGTVDCGQTVAIILRLVQDGSTVLSTTEEVINP